jgi:hypothetical protein
VALNLYEIRKEKGEAGDFFRAAQKQRPEQYQGIMIISPDGKVLAAHGKAAEPAKKWTDEILGLIDLGVEKFGGVKPRLPEARDALADRGLGLRKGGGAALAVFLRPMVLGHDPRGLGPYAVDSIILSADELAAFGREGAAEGDEWHISPSVMKRMHKLLSPSSDANTMARKNEVSAASLRARVEKVIDGVAYLRYTGRISGEHVWEFPPHKGKKIKADATLEGVGACDAKTGAMTRIVIVARGTYRGYPPYDAPSGYGGVIDWRLKKR